MKNLWMLLSACCVSFLFSCSQPLASNDPAQAIDTSAFTPPRKLTAAEQQVSNSSALFGLKLFQQAAQFESGKNMFVSPLSYAMALGMTANGANGATRDSMLKALELAGANTQEANAAFRSLTDLLLATDKNVEFRIANSIWYNQRFSVEQPFLDLARQYFDAEVRGMNFADPNTVPTINNWVEQKTNSRIKNLLQSPFDPNVDLMALINAIYFNGAWTYRFEQQNTKDDFFTSENGTKISCKMMRLDKEASFGMASGQGFTAIDIPYSHRQYTMTVVLPNQGQKLGDVVKSITPATWQTLTSRFATSTSNVILAMPKFKLETRYEESRNNPRELHGLGFGIAFNGKNADLTKMYKRESLQGENAYIGKVIHQTFLQVDERGTEAAAATAVVVVRTTSIGPSGPVEVRLDRPFAFFIREKNSGAILFAGTMYEPKN
jgi:serpin B